MNVNFNTSLILDYNKYITASDHIPTSSPSTAKVMPIWKDGTKYLRDEALY